MKHRLLTAAAARISGASPAAMAATQTPPVLESGGDETVDVVTVADANAAIANAQTAGATAERTRANAVLTSEAGAANPTMAAFMLNSNPTATAEAIVAQLGTMPKPAATVATSTPTPPPTPPAAAITTPLTQTPKVVVAPSANVGEPAPAIDADKLWESAHAEATGTPGRFGANLAGGIPRTGN